MWPMLGEAPAIRARVRVPLGRTAGSVTADVFTFWNLGDDREHIALGLGAYAQRRVPLVRPHSECLTGDVFGSDRCDCGPQLRHALRRVAAAGGYVLYLRQEGRGIGLYNKLDAYLLQDRGLDTYAANRVLGFADDERDYGVAAEMLTALGATQVDLLTDNPEKVRQLRARGIVVRSVESAGTHRTHLNTRYLEAKAARRAAQYGATPPSTDSAAPVTPAPRSDAR